MKKEKSFCCYCGNKTRIKFIEEKDRVFCPSCNAIFYENPLPVASCIVVNNKREILLVQRKKDPYKNMWCLPIGFAESGEKIHEAALRELKEEAGIDGKIIKLIDVDTVDNYFYGSLAIITYEIQYTGGTVQAGDDALDAGYFPIEQIPKLAWSSNEKAIQIYIEQNKDIWTMRDSFQRLLPENTFFDESPLSDASHPNFLSNILVKLLEQKIDDISNTWFKEIIKLYPESISQKNLFMTINNTIMSALIHFLKHDIKKIDDRCFFNFGLELKKKAIHIANFFTAMTLSRKCIWTAVIQNNLIQSPLEIYSTLELNNRIIYLYDKMNYYILKGYFN